MIRFQIHHISTDQSIDSISAASDQMGKVNQITQITFSVEISRTTRQHNNRCFWPVKMLSTFNINWHFIYKRLLTLFTICGLCPLKIPAYSGAKAQRQIRISNILLTLWSLFHLAILTNIIFIAVRSFLAGDIDGISDFNNVLKFTIMALTYFVATVESLIVRRNFISIWEKVTQIDESFASLIPNYASKTLQIFHRKTARKILICLTFTVIVELIIAVNVRTNPGWHFMWCISIIPLTMSRMRHLQHTFYVDILACRFGLIKRELKSIVKMTRAESSELLMKNPAFYDGLFKRLSRIKNVYNVLWETSLIINRSFGVSQLWVLFFHTFNDMREWPVNFTYCHFIPSRANLLQNFVSLTCDLYLVYSYLYRNDMKYILGKTFINYSWARMCALRYDLIR